MFMRSTVLELTCWALFLPIDVETPNQHARQGQRNLSESSEYVTVDVFLHPAYSSKSTRIASGPLPEIFPYQNMGTTTFMIYWLESKS